MLGDLILKFRSWVRQNLGCVHEYENRFSAMRVFSWSECRRCGHATNWNHRL